MALNQKDYIKFFKEITCNNPYGFQVRVAEALFKGKNVILRAPTGSGKTLAAVMPFLYSRREGFPFADKVLYTLPLRVLTSSLREDMAKIVDDHKRSGINVTLGIQTGENSDDELWESDLVFMTLDQLLTGYLMIPVGLPRRLDNILPGALIGSCVVLDEFHLFDPELSMKTTFEMLNRLAGLTQFIIMTATLSDAAINKVKDHFNAVEITVNSSDLAFMPSHKDKKRMFHWCPAIIRAEDVLARHSNRTIVICNTVSRAQQIFDDLTAQLGEKVTLLHSRFLPVDRQDKERILKPSFGKEATRDDAIIVTTQVIEAGIDISADVLITELAPMNAILQRAGRCARYPPPRSEGNVYIHELPLTKNGHPNLAPYVDYQEIIDTTRNILQACSGTIIDYEKELSLINTVHANDESSYFVSVKPESEFVRQTIRVFREHDRAAYATHVRFINSVNVLVLEKPASLDVHQHGFPDSIPVHSAVLQTAIKNRPAGTPIGDILKEVPDPADPDRSVIFVWHPARNTEDVMRSILVSLDPSWASYSPETGLKFQGDPAYLFTPVICSIKRRKGAYTYQCESFFTHAANAYAQAKKYLDGARKGLMTLAAREHVNVAVLRAGIMLAVALHDTGKLNFGWQDAIKRWQARINPVNPVFQSASYLAHSDYGPGTPRMTGEYKRPPHGAESATIATMVFFQVKEASLSFNTLSEHAFRALITAIAHHHNPATSHPLSMHLDEGTNREIQHVVSLVDFFSPLLIVDIDRGVLAETEVILRVAKETFLQFVIEEQDTLPVYFFTSRVLRLSDFRSLQ